MISFDEIISKIQTIHELIISKISFDLYPLAFHQLARNLYRAIKAAVKYQLMFCGCSLETINQKDQASFYEENQKDQLEFKKHLFETKCWFLRLSWTNKKRFLQDLINETDNIWTISVLLKSIWNCRPKDAIMSVNEPMIWSSYDQVSMDHNRTVATSTLPDAMINNRKWIHLLESENQCLVIAELLSIAGGPIMWDVLKSLENIYDKHKELELKDLIDCVVINEPPPEKKVVVIENKKEQTPRRKSSATQGLDATKLPLDNGQAQRELESNRALWASTIKSMKDNMKLEEIEMTFNDGTKKRIWKANRPKLDSLETIDFIQLLPSTIGKRILFYLPVQQLTDCARVNKYWAYLVEEFKSELVARQKIDIELEKLRENMLRHDLSLGLLKNLHSEKTKAKPNLFDSKSCAYTLMKAMKCSNKPRFTKLPFRNMKDLNERLERRGAADENIWKWCKNVSKINQEHVG